MTETGPATYRPSAARALVDPPRSLSGFSLEALPAPDPGYNPWAHFAVRCKACGDDAFHVGAYPTTAWDPSPHADVAPGETLLRPPHRLRCADCGDVSTIFDARTDGYDGVLNGGCRYESGESGEVFSEGRYRVAADPTYNIELEELEQIATQVGGGVKATDLFDWINIHAESLDGGEAIDFGYECA
jgi:hypothetical protein